MVYANRKHWKCDLWSKDIQQIDKKIKILYIHRRIVRLIGIYTQPSLLTPSEQQSIVEMQRHMRRHSITVLIERQAEKVWSAPNKY